MTDLGQTGDPAKLTPAELRRYVYDATHGYPPDRACLPGSDEKWDGYQLGVEEALWAAEAWLAEKAERRC